MAGRIATITGTMLTPGVSRNKRLYSKELIAKAAGRMQERIADPDGLPIVMRTHHEAGDDSVRIVGRLTGVKVGEDGAARYTADLYDTAHGRDIAALVTGKQPALKSVSIHGYWLGPVKTVEHEGERVTTGSDLEIDALDFTATPGVLGASVTAASYVPDRSPTESAAGRTPISESVEATVEPVTEDAPDEAYSAKQKKAMVAKGQAMKNASGDPSYPIKSKAGLRKAIRAVGRGGADHDAIRRHIIKRAAALGLSNMIPDNWQKDGSMKESATRYSDVREYYDGPGDAAGFCIDAFNGPTCITIRNSCINPADLRVVAKAAMDAVASALQALDPDMDADVDVDGADGDDEGPDDDMESVPAAAQTLGEARAELGVPPVVEPNVPMPTPSPQTSPADPAGETTESDTTEVPAVSEPTTPAAETASTPPTLAPLVALTQEQFAQLLDRVAPARETAPAPEAPAAETAPEPAPVEETEEQRVARLVAEGLAAAKDELREQLLREHGTPARKGFRVHESEQPAAEEPDAEQLFADRAEILLGAFGRTPQPAQ
jgi:hypothetical protein